MKNGRIGRLALLGIAAALTASLTVGSALAYFTAYCTAGGSKEMELGFTTTEIDEDIVVNEKHVRITNTGGYNCYVRVKVFAPAGILAQNPYSEPEGQNNWTDPDDEGYLEYIDMLEPGKTTTDLYISYELPDAENGEQVNVVVVYEYSPVFWILNEETGEYEYGPDWDYQVTETVTVPADNTDDSTEQEGNES